MRNQLPGSYFTQLWLLSESGRSPEPIAVAKTQNLPVTAIVNFPNSPTATAADRVYSLGEITDADVYLSGYTSSLLALGLIAETAGLTGLTDEKNRLLDLAAETLPRVTVAAEEFVSQVPEKFSFDCVGTGASIAAASQSNLLAREVCQVSASHFEADQYMHGPMQAASKEETTLLIYGNQSSQLVAKAAAEHNCRALHITKNPVAGVAGFRLPDAAPVTNAILEIQFAQILFGLLAKRENTQIGEFSFKFPKTKLNKDQQEI
ncbi:MAG: hypothetical protein CSA83_02415 [Actinomycetales bacterium]|nr:MAG: hypothetical protein CSA83_02415 [Actinomycetales bacterium]